MLLLTAFDGTPIYVEPKAITMLQSKEQEGRDYTAIYLQGEVPPAVGVRETPTQVLTLTNAWVFRYQRDEQTSTDYISVHWDDELGPVFQERVAP